MRAGPPTPNRQGWSAEHLSSNGAGSPARSDTANRLIVLGYITAVALPLIGLVLGIVLATRPMMSSKHARWIIILSIVAGVIWVAVLASGVLTTPGNDQSY